jgi:ubiquinone/menaquinone biosynthesis C-methylase UbiE
MKKKPFAVNSFELFRKEKFWKQQWNNKLQGYMTEKPKLGLLIHKWISCGVINGVESICEVAAGSCVSSLYLSKFYDVTATDFNTYGFAAAQKMSSTGNYRLRFKEENAFSFSFPNNEFDLVFHNGFLVCFKLNDEINKLISEQVRISKKYLLVVVHNRSDILNRYRFYKKVRAGDLLYDIRWWSRKEIVRIIEQYGYIEKIDYLSYPLLETAKRSRKIPILLRNNRLYRKIWRLSLLRSITFGDRLVVLLRVT